MKVIFYPPHSNSNDYVNLVVEALENNGIKVINKSWSGDIRIIIRSIIAVVRNKNIVFHFNWLEDNASKKGLRAKLKCELLLLFMKSFNVLGGRLVWTMHNAKSHNESNKYQKRFIKKMLKNISLVIVHCSESSDILSTDYGYKKKQVLYVPHGNYCKVVELQSLESNKATEKVNFLYFGTISPYKGIDILIKAFDCDFLTDSAELFISGKPNTQELKRDIEKLAVCNDNIHTDLKFLSNQELSSEISNCDVVVLPYDKESMQNSGSVIMALSCGKPVIVPLFGYIKDIKEKKFIISYDYDNKEDQVIKLRDAMINICKMESERPGYCKDLGFEAREFARLSLDWDQIMKVVIERYKKLFERN